jgi:hypothetical protein
VILAIKEDEMSRSKLSFDEAADIENDPSGIGEFGEYIPSPEQIRRECVAIRGAWSEKERRQRGPVENRHWSVPVMKTTQWLKQIRFDL